jgi:hypothetical protein
MAKDGNKAAAASKSKVALTPEQEKHKAALANIKTAATVDAAFVQWKDLRDQAEALHSKKGAQEAEYRNEDKLRTKAAAAQDYTAAQMHKNKQDTLQAETGFIKAQLGPLVELTAAARDHYTELFLGDERAPYNRKESVTLYRIQVINPVTKNFESVHYLDSCDTVSMQLDGQSFSSEAYHLGTWAEEKGFVVRRVERPIEF